MGAVIACLLLGVITALVLPAPAPQYVGMAMLAIAAALLLARSRTSRLPGVFMLGLGLASVHVEAAMSARLDPAWVGVDIDLVVRIDGLVRDAQALTRFQGRVVDADPDTGLAGRRLSLSWYGQAPELAPGEEWQLVVRLRRPRSLLNPGGFDRERHALSQRIVATGYVRDPDNAVRRFPASGLHAWRDRTSRSLAARIDHPGMRYVRALTLGDTRHLDGSDWQALRATGLSHLLAISGFHVGVVAGFGALLARVPGLLWPVLFRWMPRPHWMAFGAVAAAAAYAMAAGFALPTQRALLMILVVAVAHLWMRRPVPGHGLLVALFVLVVLDPLSVLSFGFWLSFLGVGWLVLCLSGPGAGGYVRTLVAAQAVVTVGLMPLTIAFFSEASLIGPLANMLAIPWVTVVVVPMALAGVALDLAWAGLGTWPLLAAAHAMEWTAGAKAWLASSAWAMRHMAQPHPGAVLLALLGAAWLLAPRGTPGKGVAVLLWLPLLMPRVPAPVHGMFELWMIDVGQGLSLAVRTRQHVLLYDAGPASPFGGDMGRTAVVPALRALGVRRLDTVMISHGDNDHAGGLGSVLQAWPQARLWGPAPWLARIAGADPGGSGSRRPCEAGAGWEWDGVRFEVLHPTPHFPELGNESSCVVRVAGRHASALLTGDIGHVVERRLIRREGHSLRSDVLVLGHHGSRNSSARDFLEVVAPVLAVNGSAHASRFNHPHPDTVERLESLGIPLLDTGEAGFIRVAFDDAGRPRPTTWRQRQSRPWRER